MESDVSERRDRVLLRPWLENMLENGNIPGLEWFDKGQMMFKVPWKHRSKKDWSLRHSSVFLEWARNTGRWSEGDPTPYFAQLKTRLRCAFNKAPDIEEMKQFHARTCEEPYKVYRFTTRRDTKCMSRRGNNNIAMTSRTTVPMTSRRTTQQNAATAPIACYQQQAVYMQPTDNVEYDEEMVEEHLAEFVDYKHDFTSYSSPQLLMQQPMLAIPASSLMNTTGTETVSEDVDIKPSIIPLTVELLSDSDDTDSVDASTAAAVTVDRLPATAESQHHAATPSKLLILQMATMFVEAEAAAASRQQSDDDETDQPHELNADLKLKQQECLQTQNDVGQTPGSASYNVDPSCGSTSCDMDKIHRSTGSNIDEAHGSTGSNMEPTHGSTNCDMDQTLRCTDSNVDSTYGSTSNNMSSSNGSTRSTVDLPVGSSGLMGAVDLTSHAEVTTDPTQLTQLIDLTQTNSPDVAVDLTQRPVPTTLRVLPLTKLPEPTPRPLNSVTLPANHPKPRISFAANSPMIRHVLLSNPAPLMLTRPQVYKPNQLVMTRPLIGGAKPLIAGQSVSSGVKLRLQDAIGMSCKVEDMANESVKAVSGTETGADVCVDSSVDELRQHYMHKEQSLLSKAKLLLEKEAQLKALEKQLAVKQEALYWRERCLRSEFAASTSADGTKHCKVSATSEDVKLGDSSNSAADVIYVDDESEVSSVVKQHQDVVMSKQHLQTAPPTVATSISKVAAHSGIEKFATPLGHLQSQSSVGSTALQKIATPPGQTHGQSAVSSVPKALLDTLSCGSHKKSAGVTPPSAARCSLAPPTVVLPTSSQLNSTVTCISLSVPTAPATHHVRVLHAATSSEESVQQSEVKDSSMIQQVATLTGEANVASLVTRVLPPVHSLTVTIPAASAHLTQQQGPQQHCPRVNDGESVASPSQTDLRCESVSEAVSQTSAVSATVENCEPLEREQLCPADTYSRQQHDNSCEPDHQDAIGEPDQRDIGSSEPYCQDSAVALSSSSGKHCSSSDADSESKRLRVS